jgi:hypothetical protein
MYFRLECVLMEEAIAAKPIKYLCDSRRRFSSPFYFCKTDMKLTKRPILVFKIAANKFVSSSMDSR